MKTLTILFLIITTFSFGQTKKPQVLTDSTIALGIVAKDCFVGRSIGYNCNSGSDKFLKENSVVIICGAQKCKMNYFIDSISFFEIYYNNAKYYIEKGNIITQDGYFNQLINMNSSVSDSFRKYAQLVSSLLYDKKVTEANKFLDGCTAKGLVVLKWSFYDESEYTEGTGVNIKVYNPSKKTIKYLWFTFVGYNAVDDKITDIKRGTFITMKGIGPIKPEESGSYEYEYVWFTDLVQTAQIASIKIQYMDGTYRMITEPKKVTLTSEYYDILFNE